VDISSGFRQGKHKGENRPLEEGTPRAPVRPGEMRNMENRNSLPQKSTVDNNFDLFWIKLVYFGCKIDDMC